jgi:hypothetical protein
MKRAAWLWAGWRFCAPPVTVVANDEIINSSSFPFAGLFN